MTADAGSVWGNRLRRISASLAVKAVVLIAIFAACPVIIYFELRAASREKSAVLMDSVQQQGRLIAVALTPTLRRSETTQLPALQTRLRDIAGDGTRVKVFFRPATRRGGADRFFYVASAPAVSAAYLEDERAELVKTGVFEGLRDSCAGGRALAVRYANPAGESELLSSLTPVRTRAGCWVVLTAVGGRETRGLAAGQPYWKSREVQFALVIYMVMAALVLWLFFAIWRNLRRFAALAKTTHTPSPGASFAALNRIPELAGVAREFDRMVGRLGASARAIRDAAEENAHAFKTPIAVIAQAVEPLKRNITPDDTRGRRALQMIEQATERLDALVGAARQMDETIADLITPPADPVDLSHLTTRMLDAYDETAGLSGRRIARRVSPGITVAGNDDLFEVVIENLLDNALGFTPEGSDVTVELAREGGRAVLRVADRGPGVAPDNLARVFERYFSDRPGAAGDGTAPGGGHFGMGLWIVRRNIESIGGDIAAANRPGGGFEITIRLNIIP